MEVPGVPGTSRDPEALLISRISGTLEKRRMKKIYVGNLPFSATESQIRELFSKHGNVQSVSLISDRETGRPRGFGFVEMDDTAAAIQALDGYEMDGRALKVNEAQDKPRSGGGGGGGRGGRGGTNGRW
jgi:RNA recognition motif-containing protein